MLWSPCSCGRRPLSIFPTERRTPSPLAKGGRRPCRSSSLRTPPRVHPRAVLVAVFPAPAPPKVPFGGQMLSRVMKSRLSVARVLLVRLAACLRSHCLTGATKFPSCEPHGVSSVIQIFGPLRRFVNSFRVAILGPWQFHATCRTSLSVSAKRQIKASMGTAPTDSGSAASSAALARSCSSAGAGTLLNLCELLSTSFCGFQCTSLNFL